MLQTHIVLAPENVEGDLAFPCFKIAKEFSKSPADLAKELAEKLNATQHSEKGNQLFSAFVAVGPYVNASITSATFAQHIITTIWEQKADYGKGSATGKQILVE
ncbi:MAG: hypothetical protein LBP53_07560 [Candidatus Peribacteria bacterium]|nr:hypothetical protein [Candidatus Peribacteria bacterium]